MLLSILLICCCHFQQFLLYCFSTCLISSSLSFSIFQSIARCPVNWGQRVCSILIGCRTIPESQSQRSIVHCRAFIATHTQTEREYVLALMYHTHTHTVVHMYNVSLKLRGVFLDRVIILVEVYRQQLYNERTLFYWEHLNQTLV